MGQIKCKMNPLPPNLSVCATARLWLCCNPRVVMSLPPSPSPRLSLSVWCSRGPVPVVLSSFWKKRKVSCLGRRCGGLVWTTDRRGPSTTLTGRKGPSATRPGTCPSTAGQSLCAYHPKAKDRDASERKTGEKRHTEGVRIWWGVTGRFREIKLIDQVTCWVMITETPQSPFTPGRSCAFCLFVFVCLFVSLLSYDANHLVTPGIYSTKYGTF